MEAILCVVPDLGLKMTLGEKEVTIHLLATAQNRTWTETSRQGPPELFTTTLAISF